MRIAVTGTHGSGKTTLVGDFLDAQRHYEHAQEPYWELVQNGVPFADGVSADELAEQLAQSTNMILGSKSEPNIIFDRCPLDFIAYLEVVSESEGVDWVPGGKLLARIEPALQSLDLIAFLPLSKPDEIKAEIEHPKLRRLVDARLKSILRDDSLGLLSDGPRVIEIAGSRGSRTSRLIQACATTGQA